MSGARERHGRGRGRGRGEQQADGRGGWRRRSPPGTKPRSVKVSAGGSGDAQRGGSQSSSEEGGGIKGAVKARGRWETSALRALLLIRNASVNKVPSADQDALVSGFSSVHEDAKRGERSTQSHFSGWKEGRVVHPISVPPRDGLYHKSNRRHAPLTLGRNSPAERQSDGIIIP